VNHAIRAAGGAQELRAQMRGLYDARCAQPGYDETLPENRAWRKALDMTDSIIAGLTGDLEKRLADGEWWVRMFEVLIIKTTPRRNGMTWTGHIIKTGVRRYSENFHMSAKRLLHRLIMLVILKCVRFSTFTGTTATFI
jgi:hypothetical protein